MKKRIQSLLLVISMLLSSSMFACSEQTADETETKAEAAPSAENETVVVVEADEEEILPDIPEGFTFGGKNFNIICNDYSVPGWSQYDIYAEEMNGTPINDAVFERNSTVCERYDCSISEFKTLDLNGNLTKAVKASASDYDLATPFFWCGQLATNAASGYLIDLKTVETMDLSKPWYDSRSVEDLELFGKQYFVISDLTLGDLIATAGMVFNKQLYEDYAYGKKYGNLYDRVKEGGWTFDTLKSMVLDLTMDLDGNGEMDDRDFYGLLYQRDSLESFFNGCEMRTASRDEEGNPYFSLINEANANKLDTIFDFLYTKANCFHVMNWYDATSTDFTTGMCNMFIRNQAMFMWIRFADVEMLRVMDVDFGIIPVPKWDEAQERYYSTVNNYMGTATVIPVSCENVTLTGTFIEAIASESRKQLIPVYYDKVLQGKIARDEESRDMLDVIFDNRVYDIGDIYNFGGFGGDVYNMTITYNSAYADLWAKKQKVYNKMLDKFIKDFSDNT